MYHHRLVQYVKPSPAEDICYPPSQCIFVLGAPFPPSCYLEGDSKVTLSDDAGGKVKVDGTTASELAFGVGHYFREYCKAYSTAHLPVTPTYLGDNPVLVYGGTIEIIDGEWRKINQR